MEFLQERRNSYNLAKIGNNLFTLQQLCNISAHAKIAAILHNCSCGELKREATLVEATLRERRPFEQW